MINLPKYDELLIVAKEDQKKIDKELRKYAQSDLFEKCNKKYANKSYADKHSSNYKFSRIVTVIGHSLSMLIGTILAYNISNWLFAGYDYHMTDDITVGNVISVVISIAFLVLLEWKKSQKGHSLIEKVLVQSDRPKSNRKPIKWDIMKMAIIFGLSLAFNCYGAYESVAIVYGESPKEKPVVVNVDDKTKHLASTISHYEGQIKNMEDAQKERVALGKERLYKVDTREIPQLNDSLGKYSSMLASAITKWDDHNTKAEGNTEDKNTKTTDDHNEEKEKYGLMGLSVFALFDLIVLYGIYRQERYLYESHKEMRALEASLKSKPNVIPSTVNDKPLQNPANDAVIDVIPVIVAEEITKPVIEIEEPVIQMTKEKPTGVRVKKIDDELIVIDEEGKLWDEKTINNRISQAKSRKSKGRMTQKTYDKNMKKYTEMKNALNPENLQA
jgi:hypothetical protein